MTKIMLCTPSYNHEFNVNYVVSLFRTIQALSAMEIDLRWLPICGHALLPLARNYLAAEFVSDPSYTHLLWIDADMSWRPEDVLRLLQHDLDFVSGACPEKKVEPSLAFITLPNVTADPQTRLLEVDACGAAFLLTTRTVYLKMIEHYPERRLGKPENGYAPYSRVPVWNFFPLTQTDGAFASEDVGFCDAWRALGGRVYVDLGVQITHHGMFDYTVHPAMVASLFKRNAA